MPAMNRCGGCLGEVPSLAFLLPSGESVRDRCSAALPLGGGLTTCRRTPSACAGFTDNWKGYGEIPAVFGFFPLTLRSQNIDPPCEMQTDLEAPT